MPSAQLSLVPAAGGARADRWARGALESEIQTVRTTAEGGRNRALNDAAFNLGMLVAGDRLDAGDVKRSLLAAAMEAGLPELEAQKTIRSGFAAGYQKDRRSGPTRELTKPGYTNGAHTTVVESWEPPGPPAETGPAAAQPTAAEPPSAMIPRYHTAQLFAPLPPQRWCVPGLQIGPGRPTLLVGFGASAKTIAVQSLALCLATGRPVWGHFDSAPMSVLHIDYEQGLYATAKRYQRLAIGHGIDPAELEGRIEYVEMPRVYLDKKGAESEYRRACAGFDLVIVDALRGAAPFSDENDSSFRSAIDVLTFVSQCEQCSMLVLHHASKPRKDNAGAPGGGGDARTLARGSSAIYDASGCVLNFVAQPDGSKLVRQVKMPAEAEGMELEAFELCVEDVAVDGRPSAGVRVCWRKPVPIDESAKASEAFERDASRILKAVRLHTAGGSANQIVARCGVGRNRALDVLRALADEGRLELVKGPRSAKVYRILANVGGKT
jgi:hypothetical protein